MAPQKTTNSDTFCICRSPTCKVCYWSWFEYWQNLVPPKHMKALRNFPMQVYISSNQRRIDSSRAGWARGRPSSAAAISIAVSNWRSPKNHYYSSGFHGGAGSATASKRIQLDRLFRTYPLYNLYELLLYIWIGRSKWWKKKNKQLVKHKYLYDSLYWVHSITSRYFQYYYKYNTPSVSKYLSPLTF